VAAKVCANFEDERALMIDSISPQASDQEPRYLIRNDNTKKETAYKASNILEKA
jgi:hypothetical protein